MDVMDVLVSSSPQLISPSAFISLTGQETVGEILKKHEDKGGTSGFVERMRSMLEKAAEEEEKKEKEQGRERKRRRLEETIRGMMARKLENMENGGAAKENKKGRGGGGEGAAATSEVKENREMFKSAKAAAFHDKKLHKKVIKGEPKEPIKCEECGKMFASSFQLREHVSILHLRERKFECEICGQKFGRRGGVRRHVQMVHLNQLHKCPYEGCDHPGYKCSKALAAHIRSVHTNVRPYECEECGKNFVRRNDLKMHQLTHSEEATFQCACGSTFRRALYLKKHQRSCFAGPANQGSTSPDESS